MITTLAKKIIMPIRSFDPKGKKSITQDQLIQILRGKIRCNKGIFLLSTNGLNLTDNNELFEFNMGLFKSLFKSCQWYGYAQKNRLSYILVPEKFTLYYNFYGKNVLISRNDGVSHHRTEKPIEDYEGSQILLTDISLEQLETIVQSVFKINNNLLTILNS